MKIALSYLLTLTLGMSIGIYFKTGSKTMATLQTTQTATQQQIHWDHIDFQKKNGNITFNTYPSGAVVVLENEKFIDVTPFNTQLPEGVYEFIIKKEGYAETRATVDISHDENIPVDILLLPDDSETGSEFNLI